MLLLLLLHLLLFCVCLSISAEFVSTVYIYRPHITSLTFLAAKKERKNKQKLAKSLLRIYGNRFLSLQFDYFISMCSPTRKEYINKRNELDGGIFTYSLFVEYINKNFNWPNQDNKFFSKILKFLMFSFIRLFNWRYGMDISSVKKLKKKKKLLTWNYSVMFQIWAPPVVDYMLIQLERHETNFPFYTVPLLVIFKKIHGRCFWILSIESVIFIQPMPLAKGASVVKWTFCCLY